MILCIVVIQKSDFFQVLMWGDKTPLNTHFIKYVYDVFPKANLHMLLLRDPRYCSSFINTQKCLLTLPQTQIMHCGNGMIVLGHTTI